MSWRFGAGFTKLQDDGYGWDMIGIWFAVFSDHQRTLM